MEKATMSSLPLEIEEDILLRLPVKSILRLKSVCKSWYALLCIPKFVDQHLTLARKNPRVVVAKLWFDEYIFYSVDYSSILSASSWTTCKCEGVNLTDDPANGHAVSVSGAHDLRILGSCNGLLCIHIAAYQNHTLVIWNPSIKESKKFVVPVYYPGTKAYGFGYDTKISKYKLVCITWGEIYVCTLKSNYTWRRVTDNQIPYKYLNKLGGLLVNGVLHWLVTHGSPEVKGTVVAFDISSEKFMNMHLPEETKMLNQNGFCCLKVFGDSLSLVCGVVYVQVNVWVMENYGVTESWTKQFTTTQLEITKNPYSLKFFWSLENGDILIQTLHGFGLYNQENDSVRLLKVNAPVDRSYSMTSETYVESLVSLTCDLNLCT